MTLPCRAVAGGETAQPTSDGKQPTERPELGTKRHLYHTRQWLFTQDVGTVFATRLPKVSKLGTSTARKIPPLECSRRVSDTLAVKKNKVLQIESLGSDHLSSRMG